MADWASSRSHVDATVGFAQSRASEVVDDDVVVDVVGAYRSGALDTTGSADAEIPTEGDGSEVVAEADGASAQHPVDSELAWGSSPG